VGRGIERGRPMLSVCAEQLPSSSPSRIIRKWPARAYFLRDGRRAKKAAIARSVATPKTRPATTSLT